MTKLLSALSAFALTLPLAASAATFEVVNPNEPMVVVPGLEKIGPSRISTVLHCSELVGVDNWRQLITDSELDGMWECLLEHT